MKKLIFVLLSILTVQFSLSADNDRAIAVEQLPTNAKQFITQHFKDSKVSYAKVESGWFDTDYEVFFTNGNKIEFNKNGDWTEVDCKYSQVPFGVAPTIEKYVAENYKDVTILKIEKDSRDYEVKLSNRLKLKFDLSYNFIGFD